MDPLPVTHEPCVTYALDSQTITEFTEAKADLGASSRDEGR